MTAYVCLRIFFKKKKKIVDQTGKMKAQVDEIGGTHPYWCHVQLTISFTNISQDTSNFLFQGIDYINN